MVRTPDPDQAGDVAARDVEGAEKPRHGGAVGKL